MAFARAAAPMPDPRFAAMVTDLVLERASAAEAGLAECPADCCRYTRAPRRTPGGHA
jgi:hypothetical protein